MELQRSFSFPASIAIWDCDMNTIFSREHNYNYLSVLNRKDILRTCFKYYCNADNLIKDREDCLWPHKPLNSIHSKGFCRKPRSSFHAKTEQFWTFFEPRLLSQVR